MRVRVADAVRALAIVLCGCLAVSADPAKQYGIIIDAGSSGSRLYVYSWDKRVFEADKLPPPDITEPVALETPTIRVKPGIDTDRGVQALNELLRNASLASPFSGDAKLASETPIFLKATAGMRMLSVTAQNKQMQAVRQVLQSGPFLYDSDSQARIISGEEEGVFGWITANKMWGKLQPARAGELQGTYGALDLGGASTQITFKPSDSNLLADSFPLQLGSALRETLYTHSFLYYGANEARTRMMQAVMFAAWPSFPAGSPPAVLENPCFFEGYNVTFTDPRTGAQTLFVGQGDFDACKTGPVASLIDKNALCLTVPRPQRDTAVSVRGSSNRRRRLLPSPPPRINPDNKSTCSVGGEYQPPVSGITFVAFSGFKYVWAGVGMPAKGGTLRAFADAGRTLCRQNWTTVRARFPKADESDLYPFCFMAAYQTALLVDGYNIDQDDANALIVASTDATVGWALGSIIYEANALRYQVTLPFYAPFVAAVIVAALAGAALIVVALAVFRCLPRCCCGRKAGNDDDSAHMHTSADVHNPLTDDDLAAGATHE